MVSNLIKCRDGKLALEGEVLAEKTKGRAWPIMDLGPQAFSGFSWEGHRQDFVGCTDSNCCVTVALAIFSWSQFLLRERQGHRGNNYRGGGGEGVNPYKGCLGRRYRI